MGRAVLPPLHTGEFASFYAHHCTGDCKTTHASGGHISFCVLSLISFIADKGRSLTTLTRRGRYLGGIGNVNGIQVYLNSFAKVIKG